MTGTHPGLAASTAGNNSVRICCVVYPHTASKLTAYFAGSKLNGETGAAPHDPPVAQNRMTESPTNHSKITVGVGGGDGVVGGDEGVVGGDDGVVAGDDGVVGFRAGAGPLPPPPQAASPSSAIAIVSTHEGPPGGDFVLPTTYVLPSTGQYQTTLTFNTQGGFNSDIKLTSSGAPIGMSVALMPSTIPAPGPGTSVMTITNQGVASGVYDLVVSGSSPQGQSSIIIAVVVP